MAVELLYQEQRHWQMDTLVIGGTLLGTFVGAFMIQKAALEGLFRILKPEKRGRQ